MTVDPFWSTAGTGDFGGNVDTDPNVVMVSVLLADLLIDGARILDVGCGPGRVLFRLADDHPDVEWLGVDGTPPVVEWARAAAPTNVTVELADVVALPFDDGSIDAAYSTLVYQHLPADVASRSFAEVARVLRPDGLYALQYVISGDLAPLNYPRPEVEMVDLVHDSGLRVLLAPRDPRHDEWRWLLATR